MGGMPHRLFVGIRPPEAVRDALLDTMEALEGARWQDEEQLHLTLRFIGAVERPLANDIGDELGRIEWPDFPLEIDGVSHFQRKGQATAIWARVVPSDALEGLRQKIERACERAGLERETRRFTPHITIARLGRQSGPLGSWLASHGGVRAGPWQAEQFTLFESHLSPQGAHYEAVAEYPLRG
jgi:RNA 2',3'-cyclic 3'-phosphodiesterase